MTATIWSAAWFLPFVLPICLWVAFSDLSVMKIPNIAVIFLLIGFAVIGPIALDFDIYLVRWLSVLVVFVIGFLAYMIGGIGAGDIKFMAVAAAFFDVGDLILALYLFAGVLFAAVVTHQIARRIPMVRRATPDWISWDAKKFPMGLALTGTLAFYLIAALFLGS